MRAALLALVALAIGCAPAVAGPEYTSSNAATLSGVTPGATGLALLDDATASAARTTLGLTDAGVVQQFALSSGSWTNSTTTATAITGCSLTPAASSTYIVEFVGSFTAAASTTGIALRVETGTASGGGILVVRGSGVTATVEAIGESPSSSYLTTGATSAATGETPFYVQAILYTTASPTAITLYGASEVAASQVAIATGHCVVRYRCVSGC